MHCPFCSAEETRVVDSRLASEGTQVRRRRECVTCNERFTTHEVAEHNFPPIVKSDGRREPFDESKLRRGMELAIGKNRVTAEDVEHAVEQVKDRLRAGGRREAPASDIGAWVMAVLRDVDPVACVRFASVHLGFNDVRAFSEAAQRLADDMPPELRALQLDMLDNINKQDDEA